MLILVAPRPHLQTGSTHAGKPGPLSLRFCSALVQIPRIADMTEPAAFATDTQVLLGWLFCYRITIETAKKKGSNLK
jgi:hypothetical protein